MTKKDLLNLSVDAAQHYEHQTVPTVMRSHTEALLQQIALHSGERILDLACGTGLVTRLLVTKFPTVASVTGVDINPAMLALARRLMPATSIPITWQESDACTLPFPPASFEVVVCQQGLQFIPDKLAALQEMKRVLVPGGRLALTVWSAPHRNTAAIAALLRRHVHEVAATQALLPFAWHDAEVLQQCVEEAGFHEIRLTVLTSNTRLSASPEAILAFIDQVASRSDFRTEIEAVRSVLAQEVTEALHVYREEEEFVMPSTAHLVQARAA
jgi:ubiquinone/menaquinone biosynthesis C-methylase UbiE